jgi:alpha-galactosidase
MPIHLAPTHWVLETARTAYALGVNDAGMLTHRYWGARLPRIVDYPPAMDSEGWASFNGPGEVLPYEYPGYAGSSYVEPCLKVVYADGVRDVVLEFVGADADDDTLRVRLEDAAYKLRLTLHYRVVEHLDLLQRWAVIENAGDAPATLERVWSAQWHVPPQRDYRLSHLHGRWFEETQLTRERLTPGVKVLESRRLTTSHQHNPWFALDDALEPALEEHGEVWYGVLQWSGNWKIAAEVTAFGSTRVNIGVNDWDSAIRLEPGDSFTTPSSIAGYTAHGFGQASRNLHRFVRERVLPHPTALRRVLYNSWEATYFDVSAESQLEIARVAADIGVELFVMDDGWFHGRKSDNAGLGDWFPDATKFPDGLEPLIKGVRALGMEFGLWLEPEMVNPDSDLYRAHPDWVIHFPTRARTEMRNQLILNLARTDVQDYLIGMIDDLLSRHEISFIKWDMNRNASEPGWMEHAEPRELWVRYLEGLYRVWGTLRERHPDVIWQSCSGGGGRADLGILRFADQVWISDNTDAVTRLKIQEGYSQVFPALTMEAWAADREAPNVPLSFRFHVAMSGVFGIGANLHHWTESQRLEAREHIERYKQIRHIVHGGDLYRLRSAFEGAFSSLSYVLPDQSEALLFAFRTHIAQPVTLPRIRLRGLEADALYRVDGVAEPLSGVALMQVGLEVKLEDFSSALIHLERVAPPEAN